MMVFPSPSGPPLPHMSPLYQLEKGAFLQGTLLTSVGKPSQNTNVLRTGQSYYKKIRSTISTM